VAVRFHNVETLPTHECSDLEVWLAKGGASKIKTSLLNPRQNHVKFTVADAEAVVVALHFSLRIDKINCERIVHVDARALRVILAKEFGR
jgi:hypothetical protein